MTHALSSCVILLPAYQAARTLPIVLHELTQVVPTDRIAIVDDGSTDRTDEAAATTGVHLVRHQKNKGKGAALRTGTEWWLGRRGWEAIVTMDADGQHAPSDLMSLVDTWTRTKADVVTGRRDFHDRNMPIERRLSNTITSTLVSWKCGQYVADSQCGYRLMSRAVTEQIHWEADGFEAETEILLRAARRGFRITSAPVRTIYSGENSHMTHWSTTAAFVRTLLRNY